MVADDDPDICTLLSRRLELAGYDVRVASDGEAALALYDEIAPDLVIADWTMPVLSGPELCMAIRGRQDRANVPVILLTARALETDVMHGFEAGVTDYIVKPFAMGELMARITSALRTGPVSVTTGGTA